MTVMVLEPDTATLRSHGACVEPFKRVRHAADRWEWQLKVCRCQTGHAGSH
ncbi:hypothetical protein BAC2_00423 [uncultured bacterium]|nr:hypothetical protein BAC2_00423 [uncultured bacterium]